MSTPDWKEDWIAAELAGEAALADPPPEAADRVLKGVLVTVATGATVAGTASTGIAATHAGTAGASALWIKGLLLTGLVAGGVGISQMESAPEQPTAVQSDSQSEHQSTPRSMTRKAPVSAAPSSTATRIEAPSSTPARLELPAPRPSVIASAAPASIATRIERPQPVTAPKPPAPAAKPRLKASARSIQRARPSVEPPIKPDRPSKPPVANAPAPVKASKPAARITPTPIAQPRPAPTQAIAARPTPARSTSSGTTYLAVNEPPQHRASTVRATDAELRVQRQLLTRALKALRTGKPRSAQVYLRDYRRRFAAGRLDEEHRLIALRAHRALGEIAAARSAADAFIKRYPNSALRAMVERLRP